VERVGCRDDAARLDVVNPAGRRVLELDTGGPPPLHDDPHADGVGTEFEGLRRITEQLAENHIRAGAHKPGLGPDERHRHRLDRTFGRTALLEEIGERSTERSRDRRIGELRVGDPEEAFGFGQHAVQHFAVDIGSALFLGGARAGAEPVRGHATHGARRVAGRELVAVDGASADDKQAGTPQHGVIRAAVEAN
jgi:hypothetical protein